MTSNIEDDQSKGTRKNCVVQIQDPTHEYKDSNETLDEEYDDRMTLQMNKSLMDDVTDDDEEDEDNTDNDINSGNEDFMNVSPQRPVNSGAVAGEFRLGDGDGKHEKMRGKEGMECDLDYRDRSMLMDEKDNDVMSTTLVSSTLENLASSTTETVTIGEESRNKEGGEQKERMASVLFKENDPTMKTPTFKRKNNTTTENATTDSNEHNGIVTDEMLPFSPCSSIVASVGGSNIQDIEIEASKRDESDKNGKLSVNTSDSTTKTSSSMLANTTSRNSTTGTTTMTPAMKTVALGDNTKGSNNNTESATDDFIKSGTRLRTLLDTAMKKVAIGFATASFHENYSHIYHGDADDDSNSGRDGYGTGGYSTAFETAQETDIGGDTTDNEELHNSTRRMYESILTNSNTIAGGKRRRRRRSREKSISAAGETMAHMAQDPPPQRKRRQTMITKNRFRQGCDLKDDDDNGVEGRGRFHYAAELAKEKAAECMALERALKEAQSHAEAMSTANATLRDAAATSSERMARTTEALRIAGVNAANARADADAANERASCLSSQLSAMRSALDETRRSTDAVRLEHDEISTAARSVEGRLFQAESELSRMDREKRRAEEERDGLREKAEKAERLRKQLLGDLDSSKAEAEKLKKALAEREVVETARLDRMHRVEKELLEARAMLVEATSAAAETESTTAVLKDTIRELRRENKGLHEKIEEFFQNSGKERVKMNDTLSQTESEAQKLRMKSASDEEELQRLRLEKAESEKQIGQLRNRITNLESRLTEATAAGGSSFDNGNAGSSVNPNMESKLSRASSSTSTSHTQNGGRKSSSSDYFIPPLRSSTRSPGIVGLSSLKSSSTKLASFSSSAETPQPLDSGKENISSVGNRKRVSGWKRNGSTRINNTNCCVCFKSATGMMKSCMCGRPACDRRAHASCLLSRSKNAIPSVSHPGTPAPSLPLVLCSRVNE